MPVMQERVADYPRPPRLEPVAKRVRIVLGGVTILDTGAAWRVLETYHPPTYYLPQADFLPGSLVESRRTSVCEWKGRARYATLAAGGRTEQDAGWFYPEPTPEFAAIAGHVAVYAGRMDACFVGNEPVTPQPGGFYGGWVTADLIGPFKGGPGTMFW